MKAYLFYLKKTEELYAWTLDKDTKNDFLAERNPKCFIEKTISDDSFIIREFMYKNYELMIQRDYLYDGKVTISVLCTIYESNAISESCEAMTRDVMEIINKNNVNAYNLKDKYRKVISDACDIFRYEKDSSTPTLNVDTYAIFYYLFKNTLIIQDDSIQ
jgi:hypothetical protein